MGKRLSSTHRLAIAFAFYLLLALSLTTASEARLWSNQSLSQEETVNNLDANTRVERGRLLLGHHLPQISWLDEGHKIGMPPLNTLSNEKRLRLATREFRAALEKRDELDGYTISQVYAYLGQAYRDLGTEMLRQAEKSPEKSHALRLQAQQYFKRSIAQYRAALKNNPGDLRYSFAQSLVEAVIRSGDLNQALMVISEFEREQLQPNSYGDHGLIKTKADIYSILGRYEEAGLAYEEWIKRGNVDTYLMPGDAFYEKLLNLQRKTGHPNNLPSSPTSSNTTR